MKTTETTGNTRASTLEDFGGRDYVNIEQQPPQQPKLSLSLSSTPPFPLPPKPGTGQANGLKPLIPPKPKNVIPSARKVSTGTQVTLVKKSSFKSKNPSTNFDKLNDSQTPKPSAASPALPTSVKTEEETIICKPKESVLSLKEKFESSKCKKTVIEEEEIIYFKKTKVRKSIQTVIKPVIAPKPSPKPILKNKNTNASSNVTFATDCELNAGNESDINANAKRTFRSKNGILRSNSLPATSLSKHDTKYVSRHNKKSSFKRGGSFVSKNNRRNAVVYNNSEIKTQNEISTADNNGRCSLWNWNSDHDHETDFEDRELPNRPVGAIVFSGWRKAKTFPVVVNRRPHTIIPIPSQNRPFSYLKSNSDFVSIKDLKNQQGSQIPSSTQLESRSSIAVCEDSGLATQENKNSNPPKSPIPPPRRRKSLILFPPNFNIFNFGNKNKNQDVNENENPDTKNSKKQKDVDTNNLKEKITEPKKTKPKAPDPPTPPPQQIPIAQINDQKATSTPTPTSTETETDSPESEDQQTPSQNKNQIPPKSPHIYAKVNRNGKTGGTRRNLKKLNKTNSRYNNDHIEKTSLLVDPSTIICVDLTDSLNSNPFPAPLSCQNDIENELKNERNLIKPSQNNKAKLKPISENEYEIVEEQPPLSLTELQSEKEILPLEIMDGFKKSGPGCFESSLKSQCLNNKNKKTNHPAIAELNQNAQDISKAKTLCVTQMSQPVLPILRPNEVQDIDQGDKAGDTKTSRTIQELPSNTSFLFTCMNTPVVSTYQNPFFAKLENASESPLNESCKDQNNADKNDGKTGNETEASSSGLKAEESPSTSDSSINELSNSVNKIIVTDVSENVISKTSESQNPSDISEDPTVENIKRNTLKTTQEPESTDIPQVLVSDCDAETPTNLLPHPVPEFVVEECSLVSEMTSILNKLGAASEMTKDAADIDRNDHEQAAQPPLSNEDTTLNAMEDECISDKETGSGSRSESGSEEDDKVKVVSVTPKEKRNSGLLDFVDKEIQKVQSLLAEFCPPPPPPPAPSSPSLTISSSTSTSTSKSSSKPPETPKSSKKTKPSKKSFKLDIPKSVLLRKSSVPELFIAASSIALSSAVGLDSVDNKNDREEQKKLLRRSWATKSTSSVGSTTSSSSTGSKANSKDNNGSDAMTGNHGSGSSKSLSLLSHFTGSSQHHNQGHSHGHSGTGHYKGRRLSDISQFFWVDEGETSTGAIGDNEHSPLHSSNEEIRSLESCSTGRSVYRRRRTVADFFDKARKTSIASLWRPNHSSFHGTGTNNDSGRSRKITKTNSRGSNSGSKVIYGDNSSVGSGSTDGGNGGVGRRLSSGDDEHAENELWEENEMKLKAEAELLNKRMEVLSPKAKKAFYVVREILTSEKTFVNVLRLLTIDFPKSLKKTSKKLKTSEVSVISQQDLDYILGGLPILKGVNEDLLHDLEERVSKWEEGSKIADIFVKKGAFLKHYTYYIKDFEKISRFFDSLCTSNHNFATAVKNFEVKRGCHNLGLKPFMLKPVQRMPQYSLLLEDYLKHLSEDHIDFEDTVKAIGIVRAVAEHANEAIRNQMTWERLVNLQHRLPGVDILGEDKQLVKDGELMKVCRKELQPRYFALMNDCLLCMAYQNSSSKDLKVKYKLPLTRMKIMLNPNQEHPFEFSIIGIARSFIAVAKSAKERDEWMEALTNTVNEFMKRRPSFVPGADTAEKSYTLGKQAPVWVQDSRTSMCQVCAYEFNIVFRRHHCRACGKVICRHCSANEAPLKYLDYEAVRVCDPCYDVLLNEFEAEHSDKDSVEFRQNRLKFKKFNMNTANPSAKKVTSTKSVSKKTIKLPLKSQINKGSDAVTKFKGYLQWKEKRVWKRNWFVLIDCILYVFAASEDVAAIQTLPVLGYTVEKGGVEDGADEDLSFKLKHKGRGAILFQAESSLLAVKWMEALNEVTTLKDS